jgi:hypothetical protein
MPDEHPENQRIREILAYYGYSDNVHGFATDKLGWERSDKIRNIVENKTGASTKILTLFTKKLVDKNGAKINGHWLLTGEGPMFLEEKGTAATKNNEAADKANLALALKNNETMLATMAHKDAIIDKKNDEIYKLRLKLNKQLQAGVGKDRKS